MLHKGASKYCWHLCGSPLPESSFGVILGVWSNPDPDRHVVKDFHHHHPPELHKEIPCQSPSQGTSADTDAKMRFAVSWAEVPSARQKRKDIWFLLFDDSFSGAAPFPAVGSPGSEGRRLAPALVLNKEHTETHSGTCSCSRTEMHSQPDF